MRSLADLGPQRIDRLLALADDLRTGRRTARHPDRIVGLLFPEPSLRTRAGFEIACHRIHARPVRVDTLRFGPGMSAAESVADTLRVLGGWCDAIIARHTPLPALDLPIPLIDGGSARHPTQALVDLFAIRHLRGPIADLRIGLVGDLAHSRAVRSLIDAFRWWPPAELRLMAPPTLQHARPPASARLLDHLDPRGLDILYVAGLPAGDGTGPRAPAERRRFAVTPDVAAQLAPKGRILCPLPRIDEIDRAVDASPAAAYFTQSDLSVYVRMAALHRALAPEESAS